MPNAAARALLREAAETGPGVARARLPNRFRRAAHQMVERDGLVAPAFRFAIVDLERPAAATLHAGGMSLHAPRLLPAAGELTALACGVATIGARLEQRVTALCAERRVSLALALDALGNHCLHVLSRRLQDRMLAAARNRGLVLAGELRPGDPGLALDGAADGAAPRGRRRDRRKRDARAPAVSAQVDLARARGRPRLAARPLVALRRLPLAPDMQVHRARSRTRARVSASLAEGAACRIARQPLPQGPRLRMRCAFPSSTA